MNIVRNNHNKQEGKQELLIENVHLIDENCANYFCNVLCKDSIPKLKGKYFLPAQGKENHLEAAAAFILSRLISHLFCFLNMKKHEQ